VTAEDCVASIKRWGAKDSMGQKLMGVVGGPLRARRQDHQDGAEAALTGWCWNRLASRARTLPFMMPKRGPIPTPIRRITEAIGSGPFIFKRDEWRAGEKRSTSGIPNTSAAEPASGLAGGKVAKVDRVEWLVLPDTQTQVNALINGEVDLVRDRAARSVAASGQGKGTSRPP